MFVEENSFARSKLQVTNDTLICTMMTNGESILAKTIDDIRDIRVCISQIDETTNGLSIDSQIR